jgi:membrane glycosyltransferase
MLVLDADSLMSANGIVSLTDTLANDPTLGLVQTNPKLFGADTFFGRLQQFSSAAFGKLASEGLAYWSERDGNYIGHNAITRTRAFADCAGLPYMKTPRGKAKLIFSHDFVEAALLRRAGWGVRIVPAIGGSFEETPTTLIDFIRRDRRWCQGNMQHLRILWSAGFHNVSRFHMGHNALTYLMSPAWFALVSIWILMGVDNGAGLQNGLPATTSSTGQIPENIWMAIFVYGMLLAPKLIGSALILSSRKGRAQFGGGGMFVVSALVEIFFSILMAPIMVVQQTRTIIRILFGRLDNWGPQRRYNSHYGLPDIFRFHFLETCIGIVMALGIGFGAISLWLIPIALSLCVSVAFSALSAVRSAPRGGNLRILGTLEERNLPKIIKSAYRRRTELERGLNQVSQVQLAAE